VMRKRRSNKDRKKDVEVGQNPDLPSVCDKEVESSSTKRTAESNKPVKEARSRVLGGLYGCLSVPDT